MRPCTCAIVFTSIVNQEPFMLDLGHDADPDVYGHLGKTLTVRELAYWMIVRSGNLATNLLVDVVGIRTVQLALDRLDIDGVKVLRGVEDSRAFDAGLNNEVTANGLLKLRLIADHRAYSENACAAMLEILLDQQYRSGTWRAEGRARGSQDRQHLDGAPRRRYRVSRRAEAVRARDPHVVPGGRQVAARRSRSCRATSSTRSPEAFMSSVEAIQDRSSTRTTSTTNCAELSSRATWCATRRTAPSSAALFLRDPFARCGGVDPLTPHFGLNELIRGSQGSVAIARLSPLCPVRDPHPRVLPRAVPRQVRRVGPHRGERRISLRRTRCRSMRRHTCGARPRTSSASIDDPPDRGGDHEIQRDCPGSGDELNVLPHGPVTGRNADDHVHIDLAM
jgi:hypothetical protein